MGGGYGGSYDDYGGGGYDAYGGAVGAAGMAMVPMMLPNGQVGCSDKARQTASSAVPRPLSARPGCSLTFCLLFGLTRSKTSDQQLSGDREYPCCIVWVTEPARGLFGKAEVGKSAQVGYVLQGGGAAQGVSGYGGGPAPGGPMRSGGRSGGGGGYSGRGGGGGGGPRGRGRGGVGFGGRRYQPY